MDCSSAKVKDHITELLRSFSDGGEGSFWYLLRAAVAANAESLIKQLFEQVCVAYPGALAKPDWDVLRSIVSIFPESFQNLLVSMSVSSFWPASLQHSV